MEPIHSKFLVHWTGKDIATNKQMCAADESRYAERLMKILNEGLYVRPPSPKQRKIDRAFGNTWRQKHSFDIHFARLCFTEIRLSQAREHAKRYGLLGIGFDRDFIMSRGGNPAFYIQNGAQGIAAEMFARIHKYLNKRCRNEDEGAKAQLVHLEVLMGYTRTMGERDAQELKYYDEMEWRILHSKGGEDAGHFTRVCDGLWVMPFKPSDVKVIVLPSPSVKKLVLESDEFSGRFREKDWPALLTLDDCAHF